MSNLENITAAELVGYEVQSGLRACEELLECARQLHHVYSAVAHRETMDSEEVQTVVSVAGVAQRSLIRLRRTGDFLKHSYRCLVERKQLSEEELLKFTMPEEKD